MIFGIGYPQLFKPIQDTYLCCTQEYLLPDIYYVEGIASTIVKPTQAIITLNIEVKKNQAQETLQVLDNNSDNTIKAIKEQSSGELKIQTNDLSIQPYTELEGKQFYYLRIIDVAVKNGVENVDGSKKRKIKDQLIEVAIKDAKQIANVVLKQMNMIIVSVKSIVLNEVYNYDQINILQQSMAVGYIISALDL